MAKTASIRVPVCNADGVIIERVDQARLMRLARASNADVIRKGIRKDGVVRILLKDVGDDSLENSLHGDLRKLTHSHETRTNPPRCLTLKHIPSSTVDIFRAVVLSSQKAA